MKKSTAFIVLALILGFALGFFLSSGQKTGQKTAQSSPDSETIWTCSMHPQIRQPEPGQCPICGMDLIPLDKTAANDNKIRLEMSPEAVKIAQIQTSPVRTAGSTEEQEGLKLDGKISIDERRLSTQTSHLNGRIEKLFVSFTGEYVRRGQRLAEIYAPDLISAQRELQEAKRLAQEQPELLEAARNKLRYWKLSEKQISSLENGGDILERFPIYADHSGVITKRMVAVGDYIKTGEALYEVADLSRLWVVFDAYESDLPKLKIGQSITFTTPALPDQTFSAKISYIDPVVNPQTRSTAVRAEVVNTGQLLKPEMLVQGKLQAKPASLSAKQNLLVPKTAVLWTGPRSVVYVQVADEPAPAFEFREVRLGERIGDMYEIKDGLQPGDRVVTYGAFAIDAAAQLNNQSSMMNRLLTESRAEKKSTEKQTTPNYKDSTPEAFKKQLTNSSKIYLKIKDALVNGKAAQASAAAQTFLQSLEQIDMELLKGKAHMFWMELLKGAKKQAQSINQSSDLEAQRKAFAFLSAHWIEAIRAFGLADGVWYIEHCPMALDNQGANWLSQEEKTRNPYFGDAMLTCGNIVEKIEDQ